MKQKGHRGTARLRLRRNRRPGTDGPPQGTARRREETFAGGPCAGAAQSEHGPQAPQHPNTHLKHRQRLADAPPKSTCTWPTATANVARRPCASERGAFESRRATPSRRAGELVVHLQRPSAGRGRGGGSPARSWWPRGEAHGASHGHEQGGPAAGDSPSGCVAGNANKRTSKHTANSERCTRPALAAELLAAAAAGPASSPTHAGDDTRRRRARTCVCYPAARE